MTAAMAPRLLVRLLTLLGVAVVAYRPLPGGGVATVAGHIQARQVAGAITARPQGRSGHIVMNKVKLTNGGKSCQVAAGSSMLAACKKLGINVKTNCKKGDCGTCTVKVGGRAVKACIGKVPQPPKLKSVMERGLPVSR